MTITLYPDLIQGGDEWFSVRIGCLTAGSTKLIITPTGKKASNDKERAHLYELMAQRITGYIEPSFLGDEMIRGLEDEITARDLYSTNYEPVTEMGHVTNDKFGFVMGYSPDGMVGDDGIIEIKSRRQRFQAELIASMIVPDEFLPQIQAGLMVTERKWCDFICYCGGMPMVTIRVFPDPVMQSAILEAATEFEVRLVEKLAMYERRLKSGGRLIPTERKIETEMFI